MIYYIVNTGVVTIRETVPGVGIFDFPSNSETLVPEQIAKSIIKDRGLGSNDVLKIKVVDKTKDKK